MKHELRLRQLNFISEMKIPVNYKGMDVIADLRCDLIVENCLVIELKAVESFQPIHEAQILTYMKLLKAPKGVLFNFNTYNIYNEGQQTFVNEYFSSLKET